MDQGITRRELLKQSLTVAGAAVGSSLFGDAAWASKHVLLKKPVVITYANWEVFATQMNMHKAIVARFNETHKNVRVELSGVNIQKLAVEIAARDAANIVNWYSVDPFGPEGALLSLNKFVSGDKLLWETVLNTKAVEAYNLDGELYAFPSAIYAQMGVYYNEALLSKAGVRVPDGPFTFAAFEEACDRIYRSFKGQPNSYVVYPFMPSQYMVIAAGGRPFWSADGKELTIGDPVARANLQWQYELSVRRKYAAPPSVVSSFKGGAPLMFQTGRLGMFLADTYPLSPLAQGTPFRWGVVPGLKDKRYPVHVGIYPLSITATCKYPEAAYEYLHFVATDKWANEEKLRTGYGIPDRRDIALTAKYPMSVFIDMIRHADYAYNLPKPWQSVTQFQSKEWNPTWQLVSLGQMSVSEAIDKLLKAWDSYRNLG